MEFIPMKEAVDINKNGSDDGKLRLKARATITSRTYELIAHIKSARESIIAKHNIPVSFNDFFKHVNDKDMCRFCFDKSRNAVVMNITAFAGKEQLVYIPVSYLEIPIEDFDKEVDRYTVKAIKTTISEYETKKREINKKIRGCINVMDSLKKQSK